MRGQIPSLLVWPSCYFLLPVTSDYKAISVSNPPGAITTAFWVAQQALARKKMPKDIMVPLLEVKQADLDTELSKIQPGGVSDILYTAADTMTIIGR